MIEILKSILDDLGIDYVASTNEACHKLETEAYPTVRVFLDVPEEDARVGRWHVGRDGYTSIAWAVYAFVCYLTYTRYLDDGRIIHADRDRVWDAYHRLCPAEHKVAPIEYRDDR